MKNWLLSLLLLGVWSLAGAQVVVSDPPFPTETSNIVITFDASKGNAGLANFTGDVYAHTGVITNLSTGDSNWRYVVADWGVFINKAKLTRSASNPNIYTLTIGNPRTYYNVPAAEKILKLAFVFRSGAGVSPTREGKDTGNKDILLTLVDGSVNVAFAQPSAAFEFRNAATPIQILGIGAATNLSNLTLTLKRGSDVLATASNDTLSFTLQDPGSGTQTLQLIGTDGAAADTAFYTYTVRSQTVAEARPAGVEDGITRHQNGDVTFSIFAPYKNTMYLIGDFNDWRPSASYQMKKHEVRNDSVHFWITVSGLDPNRDYGFQYLVDETIRVGDPYSELVLDPNNDQWIEPATFPNLKPYPRGKTEGMLSVFRINKPVYQWKSVNYQRRPVDQTIAYEMHLRDFLAAHSYKSLTDTLQYLKKLGVTAIKLMPVSEFDGNDSWGYNPAYHMALDKYYGTPESFKVFVDSAHANNMAVIIDVVFNHATGQSPLLAMWWDSAINQAATNNPYAYVTNRHPFNVFHDLKHGSTATNFWMKKVLKYWLEEYKVDGFRFDLSKGHYIDNTPNDIGAWNRYNTWRVNHWKDNYNFLQSVSPGTYVILEHLADDSEEYALANHGMVLWGKMTDQYNEATMGWHENGKSDFRRVHHFQRSSNFQKMGIMSYMESHDEERLMYKNIQFGNSSNTAHNVKSLPVALERMQAAGAMFFTVPGPKMLWQFGELGYDVSINANEQGVIGDFRTSRKPIRWNYRNDANRYRLYTVWSELMKLRKSEPIFSSINTAVFFNTAGAFKTIRLQNGNDEVVIVANFGTTTLQGVAGYTKTGTWYDWVSGTSFQVGNTSQEAQLPPGGWAVYSTKQFPKPNLISVSNEDETPVSPGAFRLNAAYPNPFNPVTTISYELGAAGPVSVEVVDLLGRKVATLVNQNMQAAGQHSLQWNAAGLGSGVYLIRMNAGGRQFTRKVTLLK